MIDAPSASTSVLDGRTPHRRKPELATGPRPLMSTAAMVALLQGTALLPVVAWDGTGHWRVARAVAVSAITALVVGLQRRPGSRVATASAWAWGR